MSSTRSVCVYLRIISSMRNVNSMANTNKQQCTTNLLFSHGITWNGMEFNVNQMNPKWAASFTGNGFSTLTWD